MSIKVLYVIPHFGKGGAEELILKLSLDVSINNEVCILLFFNVEEAVYNLSRLSPDIKVHYIFSKKIRFLGKLRRFYTLLSYVFSPILSLLTYWQKKVYSYDIVHVNLTLPSFYLIFFNIFKAMFRNKENYVQTFHTNIHLLQGISKYINLTSWKFSDCFVYEIYEKELEKFQEILKKKDIEYIPFGFCNESTQLLANDININTLPCEVPCGCKVFMTISRVRFMEKKIDVMIRAMYFYKKVSEDFIFIIAGDGEDTNRAKLLVQELDLEEQVKFVGYVDNPELIAKFADVFVVAVVGDNTGISGMQAISSGCNVVGVQTIGDYDFNIDAKILSAADPLKLAEIFVKFQSDEFSNQYFEKMKKVSIENCINHNKFSARYLDIYRNLITNND